MHLRFTLTEDDGAEAQPKFWLSSLFKRVVFRGLQVFGAILVAASVTGIAAKPATFSSLAPTLVMGSFWLGLPWLLAW